MANIYVSCRGSRGSVHRLGGGAGDTLAASYQGAVAVRLYRKQRFVRTGPRGGKVTQDVYFARIELRKWNGAGCECVLYDGPVDDPKAAKLYPGIKGWKKVTL